MPDWVRAWVAGRLGRWRHAWTGAGDSCGRQPRAPTGAPRAISSETPPTFACLRPLHLLAIPPSHHPCSPLAQQDMFHSKHDAALLHATARAISGACAAPCPSLWRLWHGAGALAPIQRCRPRPPHPIRAATPGEQAALSTSPTAPATTTTTCCAAWCCQTAACCAARCRGAPPPTACWQTPAGTAPPRSRWAGRQAAGAAGGGARSGAHARSGHRLACLAQQAALQTWASSILACHHIIHPRPPSHHPPRRRCGT